MRRVILDTNIYGRVLEFQDYHLLMSAKDRFKVYGSVLIRAELSGLHLPLFRTYKQFVEDLKRLR